MLENKFILPKVPHRPGIYKMMDKEGKPLYIGKAKDLHKRVGSYFRKQAQNNKTQVMMKQVKTIETTITNTEVEALLLENNLIKQCKPRYNILLRDDKSYPYIRVTTGDKFPRITFYRGSRKHAGSYYGPYPGVTAVRETLNLLHKLFRLRHCENSMFKNRSRPCLQYQIKRCSAPCVNLVSHKDYHDALNLSVQFLSGQSKDIITTLIARMDLAAQQKKYELAARYRDQVELLRQVSERQYVSTEKGELDIIAVAIKNNFVCVQVFNIRGGLNIGNTAHYPILPNSEVNEGRMLAAFIGQYYLVHHIPHEVIFNHKPDEQLLLQAMLEEKSEHKVKLSSTVRGTKRQWINLAEDNAECALEARMASRASVEQQLFQIQTALQLSNLPKRMECFDVSHTMGEKTVASCVIFNNGEPAKHEYRRFNIEGITKGDDYAAMRQALERRYKRLSAGEYRMPDILLIDGGKGQLNVAGEVLRQMDIKGVCMIGVAKGERRKPGLETLFLLTNDGIQIVKMDTAGLYMIQRIRDEAHRFAISGHRQRRSKQQSPLDQIPGVGAKRKQNLIKHFGGLQGITRASIEELKTVPGISSQLAESIYERFHSE